MANATAEEVVGAATLDILLLAVVLAKQAPSEELGRNPSVHTPDTERPVPSCASQYVRVARIDSSGCTSSTERAAYGMLCSSRDAPKAAQQSALVGIRGNLVGDITRAPQANATCDSEHLVS